MSNWKTKEERYALLPTIVHCVRLGDHYVGKMFELLTAERVVACHLPESSNFTAEAWLTEYTVDSDMGNGRPFHKNTILKDDLFMVLDAVSLTKKPLTEERIEELRENGYWAFTAKWYFLVLWKERTWFFESQGRLSIAATNLATTRNHK